MGSILIKNGQVVTEEASFNSDILIEEEKIAAIGLDLTAVDSKTQVIDAMGCYIFPGGIDPHVHLHLPAGKAGYSSDDFDTGTKAAIAGGTTTVIDFVTPEPGESLVKAFHLRKEQAQKACCDYSLHMSITDWQENTAAEIKECIQLGMTSFKVYMAYKKTIGLQDYQILKTMQAIAQVGGLLMVHCENGDLINYLQEQLIRAGKTGPQFHPISRPKEVEIEAVDRILFYARYTNCPVYIVHVSTGDTILKIVNARLSSLPIFAETCPHYLILDDSCYQTPGFKAAQYVMSPPLRSRRQVQLLWNALREGHFHVVATDHCPFHFKNQKEKGSKDFTQIPNGIAGIENRLTLLYTRGVGEQRITLNQFVQLTATGPAKLFGLYPKKGVIAKGSDADLILWDPRKSSKITAKKQIQNCDTNVYEGIKIQGQPVVVLLRGNIVFQKGKLQVKDQFGQFIRRDLTQFSFLSY